MLRHTTASFDFDAPINTPPALSCPAKALTSLIDGRSMLVDNGFSTDINSRGLVVTRQTFIGDKVDVYRNLNKPSYFSCKQREGEFKGKVSGYANIIVIEAPEFIVSEASRQRILSTKSRTVHAFVRGRLTGTFEGKLINPNDSRLLAVSYSPYLGAHFFRRDNNQPITRADYRKFAIVCGADVYLTDLNFS
jgi:hypothetical protein